VREPLSADGSTGVITGLAPASISFRASDLAGLNVITGSGVTSLFGAQVGYFFDLGFPVTWSACDGGSIVFL
jgi:hypothetical protein